MTLFTRLLSMHQRVSISDGRIIITIGALLGLVAGYLAGAY